MNSSLHQKRFLSHGIRQILALWGVLAGSATLVGQSDDARPVENAARLAVQAVANPSLPTLWLIGDSTVKVGTPGQRGWGEEFAPYFDLTTINVVNRAIGGRSSRTFQTEGRWAQVLSEMKAGDIVIIQFGHNDGGAVNDTSRARGTLRGTGDESEEIDNLLTKKHEIVRTYGWYMRSYIDDAKTKGATAIVCSLIPRKTWKDGRIARATDGYAGWAAEAAKTGGALFVDLNDIVATRYEELGPEKVNAFFADAHTHTTVAGAQFNAACVIAGLNALSANPLTAYYSLKAAEIAPWKAKTNAR